MGLDLNIVQKILHLVKSYYPTLTFNGTVNHI